MHFLAQIAQDNGPMLLTYGPLGAICAWFMLRGEKVVAEIRSLSHRIDGLTRALLVDMAERDNIGPRTRDYCHNEIAKIDARLPK